MTAAISAQTVAVSPPAADAPGSPVTVNDPTIKSLLLGMLVSKIDEGGIDELLAAGYSPDFVEKTRYLKARDLASIANAGRVKIRIHFDEHSILQGLEQLQYARHVSKLREYFILNGAPSAMVCDLFKMTSDEVRELRRQLAPGAQRKGRTRVPDADVAEAIYVRWKGLKAANASMSMRELIYLLHQEFKQWDLASLCQALNESNEQTPWTVSGSGELRA